MPDAWLDVWLQPLQIECHPVPMDDVGGFGSAASRCPHCRTIYSLSTSDNEVFNHPEWIEDQFGVIFGRCEARAKEGF